MIKVMKIGSQYKPATEAEIKIIAQMIKDNRLDLYSIKNAEK